MSSTTGKLVENLPHKRKSALSWSKMQANIGILVGSPLIFFPNTYGSQVLILSCSLSGKEGGYEGSSKTETVSLDESDRAETA